MGVPFVDGLIRTVLDVLGEPVTRLDTGATLTGVIEQQQDLVALGRSDAYPALPMTTVQVALRATDGAGLSRGDRLRFRDRDWRIVARTDEGDGALLFDCQPDQTQDPVGTHWR